MVMNPKKIKKAIVIGAASGLLVISTTVALISLLPLYSRIKQQEEQSLLLQTDQSAVALEIFLRKAQEQGLQFAQNLQVQQVLSSLNTGISGKISSEKIKADLQQKLNQSVVGIVYLDSQNQKRFEVGKPLPDQVFKSLSSGTNSSKVKLFEIEQDFYFTVINPVINSKKVGTSIVLFQFPQIEQLNKCTRFSQVCHAILGIRQPEKTEAFFPLSNFQSTSDDLLLLDPSIKIAIDKSIRGETGALWCKECDYFIAYSPVQTVNGGLLLATGKFELYSSIYRQFLTVAGAIIILIGLGTTAVVLILRPLTNQMQAEILERQKAEIALRQEKDFNQTLFHANPAFLIVLDPEGKVKLMNDTMLKALGYTLEEVVGTDYLTTFVPRQNKDALPWVFELMIHRRLPLRTEETVLMKNGKEIIVEWYGRAVFNPETDEYEYFLGAGLDRTERKRAEEELQLLQRITSAVSIASDFDSAIEVALRLVCETTGWEFGEAWVPNAEKTYLEYSTIGYENHSKAIAFRQQSHSLKFAPNEGLPGRVWSSQKPEWIPDISRESETQFPRTLIAAESEFKAGFGVPILSNNQVLAILVFLMSVPKAEDRRLVEFISSIATQLGTVFERKQAEAKYRNIFKNAVEGIFQMNLKGQYTSVNPALANILGYSSPQVLLNKQTPVKNIYFHSEQYSKFIQTLNKQGEVSNFESQVYRQDGRLIWILQNARAIRSSKGKQVIYYEGSVIDITNLKKTEERLRYSASHDALTNLWNRSFFIERLKKSITRLHKHSNYRFAVLFLDLDGFKIINDSLGHGMGDLLLIEISKRLKSSLHSGNILCRLGGDEFTILLERISDINEAQELASRVLKILNKPFTIKGHKVFVGTSIGIVKGTREYHLPPEILRDADTAMYRAKKQGKGCAVLFDAAMRTDTLRRLQIQTDLRFALEQKEFQLYYQPIIELSTSKIAGFEALLRWEHPQQGFISPGEFIPVAEETGIIVPLGEWVLREACRQLHIWKEKFISPKPLMMSVNLSSQQFTADLSQRVDKILQDTDILGRELKLEITETAIMTDPQLAIATLNELKQRGIMICIDDFGTGYCSLGYLHQFPVDILKIDRSFVNKMQLDDKREIVRVIVELAESLRMDAIAEGIETKEQYIQLQNLNCKYGQGYYFSKPLHPKEAEQWVIGTRKVI
jgi:diguanylate cyclase (GGDEF)-like protein/PAS domain S-box-containing protein